MRRKPYSWELSDLYFSPNIIWTIKSKNMGWAWHVAGTDEKRDAYIVLVGKPGRKGPHGRPKNKFDFRELVLKSAKWINQPDVTQYLQNNILFIICLYRVFQKDLNDLNLVYFTY